MRYISLGVRRGVRIPIPASMELRDMGITNISLTEEYFTIDLKGSVDVDLTIPNYIEFDDIYKRIELKLKSNGFASGENIFKILKFLDGNRLEIENAIEYFRSEH